MLLAKWLPEHDPHARVLVVTDRDELDKQIEGPRTNPTPTLWPDLAKPIPVAGYAASKSGYSPNQYAIASASTPSEPRQKSTGYSQSDERELPGANPRLMYS